MVVTADDTQCFPSLSVRTRALIKHRLHAQCLASCEGRLRSMGSGSLQSVVGVPALAGSSTRHLTHVNFFCPCFPGQHGSVCSFRLARLSSWRVHAGLVSHGVVRPHEDLWWRGSSPTLYSARNYNYDVAVLRLNFSGEFLALGGRCRLW